MRLLLSSSSRRLSAPYLLIGSTLWHYSSPTKSLIKLSPFTFWLPTSSDHKLEDPQSTVYFFNYPILGLHGTSSFAFLAPLSLPVSPHTSLHPPGQRSPLGPRLKFNVLPALYRVSFSRPLFLLSANRGFFFCPVLGLSPIPQTVSPLIWFHLYPPLLYTNSQYDMLLFL